MGHRKNNKHLALRALAMGLAGGMRAWSPLAMLSLNYDTAPEEAGYKHWPVFRDRWGRLALISLGAVEYVADKWPRTIKRTRLMPQPTHTDGGLIGRSAFVTAAGAALGSEYEEDNSVALGASIGLGTALLSNIAFYRLRKAVVEWSGVHDYTIAMIEDGICIGLLTAVARTRPVAQSSETYVSDRQEQYVGDGQEQVDEELEPASA